MTRPWHVRLAALAVAAGLVLGAGALVMVEQEVTREAVSSPRHERPSATGRPFSRTFPTPAQPPNPVRPPIPAVPTASPPPAGGPPYGTLGIAGRYLENYAARRAGWDEVIDRGKPLPAVSARCAHSWRTSGKDPRLDWTAGSFWCLSGLRGRGYRPQGVAGSATTRGYRIDGQPAADRQIILASWYSRAREPGLFAPNRAGQSVTRLVVLDMDQRRYNTVELVRAIGSDTFRNLNSHGSGLVWAGQYIYLSSHSALWLFNADDIVEIDGHFVLPAVARWTVSGRGGLSSISLDRSTTPSRLTSINYATRGQTYVQSFDLAPSGLLANNPRPTAHGLVLTNQIGEQRRVVHSARSLTIPGTNYQGIGTAGPYGFANSSALKINGRTREKVDAMVVLRAGKVIKRFRLPRENVESVYIDYRRGTYVSVTERGGQIMFELPLRHLTEAAER